MLAELRRIVHYATPIQFRKKNRVPRSARLELVQPKGAGRAADAYAELGPGAWTVRVSVVDLDAKAADLAQRGTRHVIESGRLRPDPAETLNVPFEFVAA